MSRISLTPRMHVGHRVPLRSPAQVLLHDFLLPQRLPWGQAARRMGVSSLALRRWLLEGERMTPEFAHALARGFGTTAFYWMVLEARWLLERDMRP